MTYPKVRVVRAAIGQFDLFLGATFLGRFGAEVTPLANAIGQALGQYPSTTFRTKTSDLVAKHAAESRALLGSGWSQASAEWAAHSLRQVKELLDHCQQLEVSLAAAEDLVEAHRSLPVEPPPPRSQP